MTPKEIKLAYGLKEPCEIHQYYKEVDTEMTDPYLNNSPLHIACEFADSTAVEILLQRGMDSNIENENRNRPLHSLILRDRDYNDTDQVLKCAQLLLDNGASVIKKNIDGKTPTILAAENGDDGIIDLFVERGLKVTLKDKEGNNALHAACNNVYSCKEDQFVRIAELLIEAGIDPEEKNGDGLSAIDIANKRDSAKLISIVSGGDAAKGLTLVKAIEMGDIAAVKSLIEAGEDLNVTIDESGDLRGKTPLGAACYLLNSEMVDTLLTGGANPNYKSADGKNALGELLGENADIYYDWSRADALRAILKGLHDSGLGLNDTVDDQSNTPLIKALMFINRNRSFNGITLSGVIAKFLLKAKCDVNHSNLSGQTALMLACQIKRSEGGDLLSDLLEMDADIEAIDKQGNTPLIYAAMNDNDSLAKEMAELLLEFGTPSVEHVNNEGKSALDIATERDNEELVSLLLMNI